MLSTPAMQMAAKWNQVLGGMDRVQNRVVGGIQRGWKKVGDVFRSTSTEVASLRKEINSLNAYRNFHMKVDSSEYVEAGKRLDDLRAKLKSLGGDTGSSRSGGGFGRKAAGLVAALGGGLPGMLMAGGVYGAAAYGTIQAGQAAVGSTVAPAMTRQMQEFQLGFQLGDQSAGKQLSNEIKKLAIANPFLKSEDAFKITPALLTAGFKGTEIPDKLNLITNLSTMSGKSLEEIALQYKQIKMNGIAQWEELGQLADKLPVMRELMKLTGAKDIISLRKMIEDRKVTFDMVDKALGNIRGAKDFGQKASGQSLAKYNTLVDSFQEKLISLGTQALPAVNKVLEYTATFLDRIAPLGEPILKLAMAFGPVVSGVANLLQALGVLDRQNQISAEFIAFLAEAVTFLGKAVTVVSVLIKGVFDVVAWLFEQIAKLPLMKFIGGAFGEIAKRSDPSEQPGANHLTFLDPHAKRNGKYLKDEVGGGGGSSLGQAAGLDATVSGAQRKTVIINVQSLIQKSEIHVAQVNEAISDLEGKVTDALLRVLNSASV